MFATNEPVWNRRSGSGYQRREQRTKPRITPSHPLVIVAFAAAFAVAFGLPVSVGVFVAGTITGAETGTLVVAVLFCSCTGLSQRLYSRRARGAVRRAGRLVVLGVLVGATGAT